MMANVIRRMKRASDTAFEVAAYLWVRGSRLEVFPGSGHLFFIEDPVRTGALLLEFLDAA